MSTKLLTLVIEVDEEDLEMIRHRGCINGHPIIEVADGNYIELCDVLDEEIKRIIIGDTDGCPF